MFRPDPTIAEVSVAREQVVAIVESINQPQIFIPGKQAQAAQGHLCGVRNADGSFSVYVALHLLGTAENVVYTHEPSQFPVALYREVEAEGLQFLESMGFMLDHQRFSNLSPEQQAGALERVPLFSARKPAPEPGEGPTRAAAARLLASF